VGSALVEISVADPDSLNPDQIQGFDDQKLKKIQLKKFICFDKKICDLLIPRPPQRTIKLQERPSALKREHSALQKMKFCLPGSGSRDPIESGSNADPDPQHCIV
jgi:hypothetical protein